MDTKNKTSNADFNATIGNTVLCDGFLIPMTDFVLKSNEWRKQWEIPIEFQERNNQSYRNILNYAKFLKQPLKLEMFVPCDNDGNILEKPQSAWSDGIEQWEKAKEKFLFEGFKPYEDYECAKYEEVYVDEEVCDGKFTIEDLIKDAGKTKIKLSQTALNAIFG